MSYQIKWGDTLSGIAARNNTTVSALMRANPQITNANLIYAGRQLNIPGRSDGFSPAQTGGGRPSGSGPVDGGGAPTTGPQGSPLEIARSHLGKNAGSLKLENSAVGRSMQDWVPNNVNCANFVSGVLVASGQISQSQVNASVFGLMANLDRDPQFQRVSLSQARPGDVVSMKTPGGQHVVMFAGWQNGKPVYIGSNNVNSDGSQRVTMTSMNYPIMAIHHYKG